MEIFIKNMVCVRCKMAVKSVLDELHINYLTIALCKVVLTEQITAEQQIELATALKHYELELMEPPLGDNKRKIIVERIKTLIIEMLRSSNFDRELKFSVWLSNSLHYDYTYLANIFSEMEGITIEKFYILNRIQRVKELVAYEGLSLKEISYQLDFSSVSHLSFQFKKVTGQTPSMFKKLCETADYVWNM